MEAGPSSGARQARPAGPEPGRYEASDSGTDSEEEDTILKRIPVYYTPHYLASLTLLQYPDRAPRPDTSHPLLPPALRPQAKPKPERGAGEITARYKPRTQHLEITVPLENTQPRWNHETAQKHGRGVLSENSMVKEEGKKGKGKKKQLDDDEDEEDAKPLNRMTYASHAVPDATNYLVGVIKNNALHLNPVTQTYQLRPYLNYLDNIISLDKATKTKSTKDATKDGDDSDSDEESKAKLPNKAVQVSIKPSADLSGGGAFGKSGASGGGNGRAGADLFDPLRNKEGEAWIKLEHYHVETPQAVLAFDHMFTDPDFLDQKLTSITKPTEYLKVIPSDK